MNQEPKVFVVDDEPDVRNSIKWVVEPMGYHVEVFASAEDFLQAYTTESVACLVLDVRMPGTSGIELQGILREKGISLPIIFMTAHGDIPMTVSAMKAGAVDFLTKPINNQLLLETINKAIKADMKSRGKEEKSKKLFSLYQQLTPREQEVMGLILKGKMTKTIAEVLGISVHTVELHRSRILKKMQVRSAVELVSQAMTHSLLSTAE